MTTFNQTAKILGRAIATLAAGATLTIEVAPVVAFTFTQTIENVSVYGKTYDVSILMGSFSKYYNDVALYPSSYDDTYKFEAYDPDLTFTTKAEADAVSQALFDLGVFSVVDRLGGTAPDIRQVAYTPYYYDPYSAEFSSGGGLVILLINGRIWQESS